MRRVLLIGGSGQLGTEIRRTWTNDAIVSPSHEELDLEDEVALSAAMERHGCEVVVNCAAFHNVDRCEESPERAFAANAVAVGRAARACRDRDVKFVTISTDYVFDGTATRPYREDDVPRPISVYGTSKYAGELLVALLESNALVVRTCGVYGVRPSASKGHTFVDRVIAQTRSGEPVRVVDDVTASPTFAGDLAGAIAALLDRNASGLFHAVNVGPVTWYDFACEAIAQAGLDPTGVEPIEASQWKAPARRPAYSALENARLAGYGIAMPSWREGLASYLRLARLSPPGDSP